MSPSGYVDGGGKCRRQTSHGSMKYRGSTRGAVISPKELVPNHMTTKLVLAVGACVCERDWDILHAFCFADFEGEDVDVDVAISGVFLVPSALMVTHAQKR